MCSLLLPYPRFELYASQNWSIVDCKIQRILSFTGDDDIYSTSLLTMHRIWISQQSVYNDYNQTERVRASRIGLHIKLEVWKERQSVKYKSIAKITFEQN